MGTHKTYKQAMCAYCEQFKFIAAHGLCRGCYYHEKRHGTLERKPRKVRTICKIEACGQFVVAHGFCDKHRIRSRSSGVPNAPRVLSTNPKAVYERERRHRVPQRKRTSEEHKNASLKKVFGITLDQYNEMLDRQCGVCAICGEKDKKISHHTKKPMSLAVDHCHETSKIRGLLCSACNHGLGNFRDNVKLLGAAIAYLQKHASEDAREKVSAFLSVMGNDLMEQNQ